MDLDPGTLALLMAIASLAVFGLFLHYISRVGRRYDMLCFYGLLAVMMGLLAGSAGLRTSNAPPTPVNLFSAICTGFTLCCLAFVIWREGLKRFRDSR